MQTSYGTLPFDPNATRLIEELTNVLNDVELRVQAIKLGLVQALPHLAGSAIRPPFVSPSIASPWASPFASPYVPQLGGPFGALGVNPFATMGINPFAASVGQIGIPFGGVPSFRL